MFLIKPIYNIKYSRKILYIAILFFSFLGLDSCNSSKNKKENKQEVVKVGAILPLSGEMSTYGQSARRGIKLAVKDVNSKNLLKGKKMKLLIADSKTKTQKAISALQKMINVENVRLFIGDISSTITLNMIPIIEQHSAFLFSPGAASPKLTNISRNFARNWPSSNQEANSAAEYAIKEMKDDKAAIIYVNNDWGVGLQKKFKKRFKSLGGSIAKSLAYNLGKTNFRTLIVKLNQSNVPLIYLAGNQKEMGNFIKQLRKTGNNTPVIANTSFLEPDALKLAGKYATDVIIPTPVYNPRDTTSRSKKSFFKQSKQEYPNIVPNRVESNGFDSIMLIAKAYNKVGHEPLKISKYIRSLKQYSGAAGKLNFINGDVKIKMVFKKIVDGKPQIIK